MQSTISSVISEAYTARLQPVQRLKAVPSGLDWLHSQQTEPAMASNGRATWIAWFEAIAPINQRLRVSRVRVVKSLQSVE